MTQRTKIVFRNVYREVAVSNGEDDLVAIELYWEGDCHMVHVTQELVGGKQSIVFEPDDIPAVVAALQRSYACWTSKTAQSGESETELLDASFQEPDPQ